MLKENTHVDYGGYSLMIGLAYKYSDGPDCLCTFSTFSCTDPCRLEKGALVGEVGIGWDFYFGAGTWSRKFNDSKNCHTVHQHEPPVCSEPEGISNFMPA